MATEKFFDFGSTLGLDEIRRRAAALLLAHRGVDALAAAYEQLEVARLARDASSTINARAVQLEVTHRLRKSYSGSISPSTYLSHFAIAGYDAWIRIMAEISVFDRAARAGYRAN